MIQGVWVLGGGAEPGNRNIHPLVLLPSSSGAGGRHRARGLRRVRESLACSLWAGGRTRLEKRRRGYLPASDSRAPSLQLIYKDKIREASLVVSYKVKHSVTM